MISIVHVNQHHIRANAKDGGNRPVCTVKLRGQTLYGREVKFLGPCRMVQSDNPLSCGARVWLETEHPIEIIDQMSFSEARDAVA